MVTKTIDQSRCYIYVEVYKEKEEQSENVRAARYKTLFMLEVHVNKRLTFNV